MPQTNVSQTVDFYGQKFYIGLDVHKKSWNVTVRSLSCQVAHFTQPASAEVLFKTLKRKFPGGIYYSAYEAGFCGTSHHEQLCTLGIDNIIVHAADIPQTDKEKKNKTDLHDSRSIATHLERKNLHGIHIFSRRQQELRSLFRFRQSKVKDVTRANNRLKGFLNYFGIILPEQICKKQYLSKKALEWLSNFEMHTQAGLLTKQELIQELRYQRTQKYLLTKKLRVQLQLCYSDAYLRLISVPGIGAATAMALLCEIGDFDRFDDPDDYISYIGLTPWNDSSGNTIRTKGMQPRCNKHLRPLLIEAAWAAIRNAPELFAYYSKHAAKDNKHAIVKVCRKLALIARGCVLHDRNYQPDYLQSKQNEKGRKPKSLKPDGFY